MHPRVVSLIVDCPVNRCGFLGSYLSTRADNSDSMESRCRHFSVDPSRRDQIRKERAWVRLTNRFPTFSSFVVPLQTLSSHFGIHCGIMKISREGSRAPAHPIFRSSNRESST